MTARSSFRLFLVAAQVACLAGCKGSTSPSTSAVADFVTAVTASDGTAASRQVGAPPAANGGPTLTVTSSGTVSSGGNDLVNLRAASSFQTVYASVAGADGFYQLQLAAPTTNVTLTDAQSNQLSTNSYVASYQAASSTGQVGPAATVTNTVQSSTALQLTGAWNIAVTWTSQTGNCANGGGDPINTELIQHLNVGSSGVFTIVSGDVTAPGTVNLSTGAWSFSASGASAGEGCGNDSRQAISASGTCSSSSACSGSVSDTSIPGPGTQFGTATWTR